MTSFSATSAREAARQYGEAGWAPVPLVEKSKRPFDMDWPERDYVAAGVDAHFGAAANIGLKCGEKSGGLVDVDIDDPRALTIADHFLPPTALRHGRGSNRNSHRWYQVEGDPGTTCQFKDPVKREDGTKAMLVEYRSNGAQTAVPPSVHPSGEVLSWEAFAEPAAVDGEQLKNAVRQVAAAALIAQYWPGLGGRNDAALALSGALLRGGMADPAAERFVLAVAEAAEDEQADDRVKAVRSSRKKIDEGKSVTGFPSLAKAIGEDVARCAFGWLTEAGVIRAVVEWEPPILFSEQTVPELSASLLPKVLGNFAAGLAAEFEVPVALPVFATLGTAATAVSSKVVIELKPGWREPLNLYLAVALPPGSNKTAVLNRCTKPLVEWEAAQRRWAEVAIQSAVSLRKSEEQHIESERRRASKEKDPNVRNGMFAQIVRLEGQLTPIPAYPRLFGNDLTPEALAEEAEAQGGRFAIITDEGGITETLAGLYSEGAANIDVLLKGIDGGYVRNSRKSKESIELNPYLTLVLAIQPRILQNMGEKRAFQGNGLLERFLFAVPKSNLGFRKLQGQPVGTQVETDYTNCIRNLLLLNPTSDIQGPSVLTLSPPAAKLFSQFRQEVENLMRPGEKLQEITGWAGKLPGFTARIAGLMHVAEHGVQLAVVSDQTLQQAIDLAHLLVDHALAAWQLMGADQAMADAKRVFEWIKSAKKECITRTEIQASNRFLTRKRMDQMLATLVDHNILGQPRAQERKGPGRPTSEYLVNPQVFAH